MNLENIRAIVNSGFPNWKQRLYEELAKDPSAIPTLLGILNAEREEKASLITELNFQLSRAHMGIEHPEVNKEGFIQKEIRDFYKTKRIGHCFANVDK